MTLLLPHLLAEEDYPWLKALGSEVLFGDKGETLIYVWETGAVDNTVCRNFSGLDSLQASPALHRLRD